MGKGKRKTVQNKKNDEAFVLRQYVERTEILKEAITVFDPVGEPCALGGVTPCSLALLFSCFLEKKPSLSVFLIVPDQQEAEDVYAACKSFAPPNVTPAFFPSNEMISSKVVNPATISARLKVCRLLSCKKKSVLVVAPLQAVMEEVPSPGELERGVHTLSVGDRLEPEELMEAMAGSGFKRLIQVERPGDCARRGGIMDVFSFGRNFPLRLEFDSDTLASIREFDPATQLSREQMSSAELVLAGITPGKIFRSIKHSVAAYFGSNIVVGLEDEPAVREKAITLGMHSGLTEKKSAGKTDEIVNTCRLRFSRYSPPEATFTFPFYKQPPLGDTIESSCSLLKGHLMLGGQYFVFCTNEGEREKLSGFLKDKKIEVSERFKLLIGDISEGFMLSEVDALISGSEILGRKNLRRTAPVKNIETTSAGFFSINAGDYVVHVAHGIGRFLETQWIERDGAKNEYMVLEYRDGVKLFVPVTNADLIAKYVGNSENGPALDKLNGTSWFRRCEKVQRAVHDMASDLLEIHAKRQELSGFNFSPDDEMQRQLEASFAFHDTIDQITAMKSIKEDMQNKRCMDRLLCGDVGYGKTELAIRSAFKAVISGKQVAVLVPTTVLAEQHYETFCDRLSGFPVTVEVLSRFRTKKEQKKIVNGLKNKTVDIVIGTHRLLSNDVEFEDLGLVIIDEEQRFGVAHKERFKRLRTLVDILTMTATPIPRTLHMSLLGLRDISNLTTPPEGRAPIRTEIIKYEPEKMREIILRELDRDGQVYYVHNRVKSLSQVKWKLEQIVPEARIEIAHGQLSERKLSSVMRSFLKREIDVLATTTIIESGLDIPNVNTIIISEADMYGLADLHQLRGRVGRYSHQAYAYLLLPEQRRMKRDGQKRLRAIEKFSNLGAGFKLALKDLEIRGTGNILGSKQSGHIAQVGYDMYCKLLNKTVSSLKNEKSKVFLPSVVISLKLPAYLPEDYILPGFDRVEIYQSIAGTSSEEELEEVIEKIKDRFGKLPEPVKILLDLQVLRIKLIRLNIRSVEREMNHPVFRVSGSFPRDLISQSLYRISSVEPGSYMIENKAEDDMSAFRILLKWSKQLLNIKDNCSIKKERSFNREIII